MIKNWYETDPDCCQHMCKEGSTYEMIQCVWLPTTDKDKIRGLHEYVIVNATINLNDYSKEERIGAIETYGYTEEEILDFYGLEGGQDLIAECILEENILSDNYIIGYANSFKEAKEKIKKYTMG